MDISVIFIIIIAISLAVCDKATDIYGKKSHRYMGNVKTIICIVHFAALISVFYI